MEFSIKKLIASFLILASVTGILSLVFFNHRSLLQGGYGGFGGGSSNDPNNAFSSTFISSSIEDESTGEEDLTKNSSSKNITDELAEAVFNRAIDNNPAGFYMDEKGGLVGVPTSGADVEMVLKQIGAVDLLPREIFVDSSRVTDENSTENIKNYFKELGLVLLDTIADKEYLQLINKPPSLENLKKIESALDRADKGIRDLEIPSDVLEAHKNVLGFISNHKDFFSNISAYENDPARAVLAVERHDLFLKNNLKDFKTNVNRLISLHPELDANKQKIELGLWEGMKNDFLGLFVVREAKAIPVVDAIANALSGIDVGTNLSALATAISELATGISSYVQDILEWVQKLATEKLKNYLTKLFVQQVLSWTNNSGNQRFVYNWESFLLDVEEEVTSDAIDEFVPSLCGPFQGYVLKSQGYFGTQGRVKRSLRKSCPISRDGRNLKNFYRDFAHGGWGDYFGTLEPGGNIYGAIMTADEYINTRKRNTLEKKTNELLANRGFLSQQKCEDGKEPQRGDVCEDGSTPRATTPGGLVGDTLGKAFGAPLDRVVNASDLTGLVAALLDGALSGVLSSAQSKVDGVVGLASTAFGQSDSGRGLGEVVCNGLEGDALTQCLVDAVSTEDTITENDQANENSTQARQIGNLWQDVKSASDESLSIIEQMTLAAKPGLFKGFFDLIQYGEREGDPREFFPRIPGCPRFYPENTNEQPNPEYNARAERRVEVDILRDQIVNLRTIIQELNSEVDYDKLNRELGSATGQTLPTLIQTYGTPEEIQPKVEIAEDRLDALRALRSELDNNLKVTLTDSRSDNGVPYEFPLKSACNVPLTTNVFVSGAPILVNP